MSKARKGLRGSFEKGSIEEKAKIRVYKRENKKRTAEGAPVKAKEHKKLIARYKKDDAEAGVKIKYKKTPLSARK